MNTTHGTRRRAYLLGLILLATTVGHAQPNTDDDEVIELSPFEVSSSGSIGYQARDTLAGSRLRTDLRDVANAVQVINQEFLQDTGSTDSESLLVYTTNTEVGGVRGNFSNAGDSGNPHDTTQRIQPQNNTRVRGLDSADNTRNFFLTSIPWDGYNIERIDIQRGANAVLFGIGSPAGIINASMIRPVYYNQGEIEFRVGSYGSYRGSFDINRVILDDLLSVRVAGLHDNEKFRQEPAFEEDQRLYAALRLDPKVFGERHSTRIELSYETGSIDANRPRVIPPVDKITPWFNSDNQQRVYDPRTITAFDYDEWVALGRPATYGAASRTMESDADGVFSNIRPEHGGDNPNGTYNPWMDARGAGWYDGPIYVFPNPREDYYTQAVPAQFIDNTSDTTPTAAPFNPWFGIADQVLHAQRARLPGYQLGAYKNRVITDPSIFDFYENLLDGPTKYENEDFDTFNLSLSQTFLDNRIGFELVYDWQDYYRENSEILLNSDGYAIAMDVMTHYPDGTPNPNVGRPMVGSRGGSSGSYASESDTLRLTAFAQLDFSDYMDSENFLTRVLGRHVFTGLFSTNENKEKRRSWERYAAQGDYVGGLGSNISGSARQVSTANYIGPSLLAANSAAGARLERIQGSRNPASTNIPLWDWAVANDALETNNLDRYVGWRSFPLNIWNAELGQRNELYTPGGTNNSITETDSLVFVWQGYLLDGLIVPTVSWREDEQLFRGTGSSPALADGTTARGQQIFDHPEWYIPRSQSEEGANRNYNKEKDDNLSWGVVVHTPDFIREQLPYGMNFSVFYNDSSNFRPQSGRLDAFGRSITSPVGETKDYGFTVGALNDRFVLKVNWYESNVTNATISGVLGGNYLVGYSDGWGAMFATQAQVAHQQNGGFQSFGTDYWEDNPDVFLPYQPAPGQTHQEALEQMNASINALLNNPPPADFQSAWGYNINDWSQDPTQWLEITEPNNMVVTGDTESEGIEFEFSAQITPNWNITMNAAKTEATRLNLASSLASFVEERYAFWEGPAGDVRFWNGAYGGETLRSKFEAEFYGNYTLQRLLEGSNVPENREWRFNLITNYSFTEGRFRGLNIGGSYRWQDEVVIGYPLNSTNDGYDIDNPIHGPSEDNIDLWIGYRRPINEHIDWRIQLNVRNVLNDDDLIPITANPDGSGAAFRIPGERTWFVTNTFSF